MVNTKTMMAQIPALNTKPVVTEIVGAMLTSTKPSMARLRFCGFESRLTGLIVVIQLICNSMCLHLNVDPYSI